MGVRLGRVLQTGDVVALVGPLGSGKTTLTKGIAEGAGVTDGRQVNSPTFVIINEYDARNLTICHMDAYRLRGGPDLEALGFDEICGRSAVILEWADRVCDALPPDRLTLTITPVSDSGRTFACTAGGDCSQRLLDSLLAG